MTLTRYRILVSYRGDNFFGWQRQKTQASVQGAIEDALKTIVKREVRIYGATRTDTGVHALEQNAHFDLPRIGFSLKRALNAKLSSDIFVKKVWKVPSHFHCLHQALNKSYIYLITLKRSVFFNSLSLYWPRPVNMAELQSFTKTLIGRKDFKSFQNKGSQVAHTTRTIYFASWFSFPNRFLVFYIRGDGFLKQMVRNLVGTQLELMNKKDSQKKLRLILEAKNRKMALKTAPPQGLYLYKLYYPPDILRQHIEEF